MNDLDYSNITVGRPIEGGGCYVNFDAEPTLPTDATTDITSITGWHSLGELSENGFSEGRSMSATKHKGWHGKTILVTQDSPEGTYKVELVEILRGTAAKVRYGADNVTVDANGVVRQINDRLGNNDEIAIAFDELLSNSDLCRTVVKRSNVTGIDDVAHKHGDVMYYGMTFDVLEPKDGSGIPVVKYYATPSYNDIVSFSLAGTAGVVDRAGHSVTVALAAGTSLSNIASTFVLSDGATAKIGSTAQVSGTTQNTWTSGVAKTYKVTSSDGEVQDWSVTATVSAS